MWTVVFPKKLYDDLNKFLFSTKYENGCFLLANSYKASDKPVMIITEVIKPDDESWNRSGEHSLEPSSSFINKCVVIADSKNLSPVFVHTHPHSLHPAGFSMIDEKSNKRMFANLSQILPDRPLASFVFSRHGMCGVVFNSGKIQNVSRIKISGKVLDGYAGVGFDGKKDLVDTKFDRQVRALGEQNQKKIQEMTMTLVGSGGTGSPLAVQLARMGVKRLRIVDKDNIDATNLPRIYGAKDTDVGKSKVEVLKRHIECFSKTKVEAIQADVTKDGVTSKLIDSDVIFSCTDNLTSRSILNDISIQYLIPLIDIGCRIHKDKHGAIDQAVMKVQVVTPDTACLWCSGTLDGKLIMQESLSDEEKKNLAKEGYYENVDKQPSIISMTTMAASMGVNKLLALLGIMGADYDSQTQIEMKDEFMISSSPEIKDNCVCQKRKGLADRRRVTA
ncbi:MAG: ThiF family adenylyltransferase [Candidatus Nitrosotenuis sp.]|nr:MAG: ThiF family adenylyltransferase [Candidatus Nitrosotenuis sp.]